MTNEELGIYLKTYREGLGYSTYDINKLCEISPGYISLLENGKRKPSPIILKKLASLYSLDYIDLLEKAGFIDFAEKETMKNKYDNFCHIDLNKEIQVKYGSTSIDLLDNYSKLNEIGKQKANENVKDLTKINEYTERKNESQEA